MITVIFIIMCCAAFRQASVLPRKVRGRECLIFTNSFFFLPTAQGLAVKPYYSIYRAFSNALTPITSEIMKILKLYFMHKTCKNYDRSFVFITFSVLLKD
jgi:hypothetical protein